MNYREPANPKEWTIETKTSAADRVKEHQKVIEGYDSIFWQETVGLALVGAALASAVDSPRAPDDVPRILAVTVIVAALYRFAVVPILVRATIARAPAPLPKLTLNLSDAGFLVEAAVGRSLDAWDWVDDIEETGTGEDARVSICLRTAHTAYVPAADFPKGSIAAVRAWIEAARAGATRRPSTFVDRDLTPIAGGRVRFRESGDTVLNPTTRPPVLSAAEILAVRIPFAIPPFALALASEHIRHLPKSAYLLGAIGISIAGAHLCFKQVATKTNLAFGRFQVLLKRKALRRLTLQLCEEGFAFEWEGGWSFTHWHSVEEVAETENCIGYRIGLIFRAIPKKAFQPGEEAIFRAIAARKIAAAKKPNE